MKKYQEAIDHLEDFSSDDKILAPLALGGLGDAFAQLEQPADALSYYEKAFSKNENDYTTPKFLYKAGVLALDMGNKDKAATYFQRIKDDYPNTNEGNNIDALIGLAQNQ